jgi:transcriptional regulator with XRE-family HTH domain
MDIKTKEELRKQFGLYLQRHRENVLKIKSVRELSFSSNIDNSKLSKIEKGQVNFGFDNLLEIAVTYKLTHKEILGFTIKALKDQEG